MKSILRIDNLRFVRSSLFTLSLERLRLQEGTILCITGPNGSGKTTLLECITGILKPTSGEVLVNGQPLGSNLYHSRLLIGFVPDEEDWFIKELCAEEYFKLLVDTYAKARVPRALMEQRIERLARILGFVQFRQRLYHLSHGNKKKVQIIAGLMHAPKLLVIDEIRNGLDPLAIISVEGLLHEEAKSGTCIVAATHDLWWAERISKEIMLLIDGKVALHKTTSLILKQHASLEDLFVQTIARRENSHVAL